MFFLVPANYIEKKQNYLRIPFFCTNFAPAFSFREASVILAQTRCCDSQSDVHYLEGHCP
jgi:hypothetical protein